MSHFLKFISKMRVSETNKEKKKEKEKVAPFWEPYELLLGLPIFHCPWEGVAVSFR